MGRSFVKNMVPWLITTEPLSVALLGPSNSTQLKERPYPTNTRQTQHICTHTPQTRKFSYMQAPGWNTPERILQGGHLPRSTC